MAQLSYPTDQPAGKPGITFGLGPYKTNSMHTDVRALEAGIGVQRGVGADADVMKFPTNITDLFMGVTKHRHAVRTDADLTIAVDGTPVTTPALTGDELFPAGADVAVISQGTVWVRIDSAITVDSGVHLVCLAAGGDTVGHFRATADGVNTLDLGALGGVAWREGGLLADGVALLTLNLDV